MQKKYNTFAQMRYFKTFSTRLERNKSIEDIDKKFKINNKINFY